MTNHPNRRKTNRSLIKGLTVGSNMPVIVYGSVRGLVSEHKTAQAAYASLQHDQAACRGLGGGAYSDANIYVWTQDRWSCQPACMYAD